MRCGPCPVSAGDLCLGETEQFGFFCQLAQGDEVQRRHVVTRSKIGLNPPILEPTPHSLPEALWEWYWAAVHMFGGNPPCGCSEAAVNVPLAPQA